MLINTFHRAKLLSHILLCLKSNCELFGILSPFYFLFLQSPYLACDCACLLFISKLPKCPNLVSHETDEICFLIIFLSSKPQATGSPVPFGLKPHPPKQLPHFTNTPGKWAPKPGPASRHQPQDSLCMEHASPSPEDLMSVSPNVA